METIEKKTPPPKTDPTGARPSSIPEEESDTDNLFGEDEEEKACKEQLAVTEEMGRQAALRLQAQMDEEENKRMAERKM